MENKIFNISFRLAQMDDLSEGDRALVEAAKAATDTSYVPYSTFHVGAAVRLANGEMVAGSNQENAAFPSGICAERCTMWYANATYPEVPVETIAVAARLENGTFTASPISPCGACRQVLLETEDRYKRDVRVLLYGTGGIYILDKVKDLLPFHFVDENMQGH